MCGLLLATNVKHSLITWGDVCVCVCVCLCSFQVSEADNAITDVTEDERALYFLFPSQHTCL